MLKHNPFQLLIWLLFIILWLFIIIRAFTVFYIHDELVSKWSYMIDWNPFPFQGYVDANNHFLNSLLGGFFIRLFNSDSIWVIRLASILSFPIYYFSVYSFKKYFKHQVSFWFMLISLTTIPFILDFFSLSRGYALSWSFMLLALSYAASLISELKVNKLLVALCFSVLSIYSNLALLPFFVLLFSLFVVIFLIKVKFESKALIASCASIVLASIPYGYAAYYALELQDIGKLYLGEQDGFWTVTLASLSKLTWNIDQWVSHLVWILIFSLILIHIIKSFIKKKAILKPNNILPILFLLAVLSVLAQNLTFKINFPEDRAAAHLLILALIALAFSIDRKKVKKLSPPLIIASLAFFFINANFDYTQTYKHEHFDTEILERIPLKVKGIPTSTGARFWVIDNALSKERGYPMRAFQDAEREVDTIQDYIITHKSTRLDIEKVYQLNYEDKISDLRLYQRREFLNRRLIDQQTTQLNSDAEFVNLLPRFDSKAGFIRLKGKLEDIDIFKSAIFIVSQETLEGHQKLNYVGIDPVSSAPINENGEIIFDFTFTILDFEEPNQTVVYVWNKERYFLKGQIQTDFYEAH